MKPLLACALACWVLTACASSPSVPSQAPEAPAHTKRFVFKHNGIIREMLLVNPATESTAPGRPAIITLHGALEGKGDDEIVHLGLSRLRERAIGEDVLLVAPSAVESFWNDGRAVRRHRAHRQRIDDIGFLRKLIASLVTTQRVDAEKIYVVGVSSGAIMAHRVACEMSNLVDGVVAVVGSFPARLPLRRCRRQGVSVLMMNGTEDPVVPWSGGTMRFDDARLGRTRAIEDVYRFWAKHNRCRTQEVEHLRDRNAQDGTTVDFVQALGCKADVRVELYKVVQGGHTWPSGWQYLPPELVGRVNMDINAAEIAWRFIEDLASE